MPDYPSPLGLILLTMQLNISDLLWAFSKKMTVFWLVFGLCWKVLEKMAWQFVILVCQRNRPATGAARSCVLAALLPLNFWSVIAELSPLNLMDDVLGQVVIFLNLLLIAFRYGQCVVKAGVTKSRMVCVWLPLLSSQLSRLH